MFHKIFALRKFRSVYYDVVLCNYATVPVCILFVFRRSVSARIGGGGMCAAAGRSAPFLKKICFNVVAESDQGSVF